MRESEDTGRDQHRVNQEAFFSIVGEGSVGNTPQEDYGLLVRAVDTVAALQGHAVPKVAHAPRGPFPPELMATTSPEIDHIDESDSFGATAQNNFRPTKWFRCKDCAEVVSEHELEQHECPEEEGDNVEIR